MILEWLNGVILYANVLPNWYDTSTTVLLIFGFRVIACTNQSLWLLLKTRNVESVKIVKL